MHTDQKALEVFLDSIREKSRIPSRADRFDDVIEYLRSVVEEDADLKAHCNLMFAEVVSNILCQNNSNFVLGSGISFH